MINLTNAEAAYIAGFVDGEGTINVLSISGSSKFVVELIIGQVDPRPLLWIKERCGGNIRPHLYKNRPNNKPAWMWGIRSFGFDELISIIYPFLILKKEKAEIAMQMRILMKKTKPRFITKEENVLRLEMVKKAKSYSQ